MGLPINITGGFSVSWGYHEEIGTIRLYTASIGFGYPGSGVSAEGHVFRGNTWVLDSWFEN